MKKILWNISELKMTNCYECEEGKLVQKKVEYKQYDVSIGKYPAEVCTKCGEVFFSSDAVEKI
jgi:YgiT-type zinc finger domain-containing protein